VLLGQWLGLGLLLAAVFGLTRTPGVSAPQENSHEYSAAVS
jgi:hypothetical protein